MKFGSNSPGDGFTRTRIGQFDMGARPSEMRKIQIKNRSFIAIGIFVMGFTVYTFWGLSSQNNDFLVKIEQLEDNLKIGVRKQKDLQEQLESMMRKAAESQKTISRLQDDVKQKQTMIIAQAEEASKWRDRVHNTEGDIEKLKSTIADKEKEMSNLQKQNSALTESVSSKDLKLKEAHDTITQLKSQLEAKETQPAEKKLPAPTVAGIVTSSSSVRPAEFNQVLAKPEQEPVAEPKSNRDDDNNEPVGPKPGKDAINHSVDEVELVDPSNNVLDSPAKGADQVVDVKEDDLGEPNLINSQGDNLDEPQLVDKDAIRNGGDFGVRGRHNDINIAEANLPEDQEIENEHEVDDDRGDLN